MLLYITNYLSQFHSGFNVFNYLTLRILLGVLTSLVITLLVGSYVIERLSKYQVKQKIRHDGPKSHLSKSGTPTMGGLLILLAMMCSTLLWANPSNHFIIVGLAVTLAFGVIGFFDDYYKIAHNNTNGFSAKQKYFLQSIVGLIVSVYLYQSALSPAETELIIPFTRDTAINLGWMYIVLSYFVIVGSSNAVNLTDGLDGLAILPTVLIATALIIFAYATGHVNFAEYLGIPYIAGVGETAVFCASIVGAGLGFLWFNTYPAQIFMGDIGSLALGAALGVVAIIVRQELIFFLMSAIFVVEALSVMLQVASYKLTGKRIFLMAPLHHHYELKGIPEPKIIVRFWIITLIFVLIGLASLKIR